jgi:twinkle protein
MTEDSEFVRKEACPECGSRDNLARYTDGHGYCFGCGHYEAGEDDITPTTRTSTSKGRSMAKDLVEGGAFKALPKRGLTEDTCRKFGYKVAVEGDQFIQIAPYHDDTGALVAQKIRTQDKDFRVTGSLKQATLFGQNLWASGGRKVVITEGEIDAMSVSQVQGHKWPVVSIPNGSSGARKSLAAQLEWLCTFEEVVLMFDMDDPGRDAVQDCVTLFPPGKCKVASLTMKDANELLVAGKGDEIVQAIWQAKTYRPDGIVTFRDLKDRIKEEVPDGMPWFCDGLTELTHGRRWCETYFIGAGTGIGKTDLITQQIEFDTRHGIAKSATFFLEQPIVETGKRVAGKFAGKRFHLPKEEGNWTDEDLDAAVEMLDNETLFLYDNFGVIDWEPIEQTIRHLRHAEGVRIFYLDNLTALAAQAEDEKKTLEEVTSKIAMLAKELEIIMVVVSHLATPEGKPHEEGGRVMIRHFKGSRSIGFWAHYMFGLERDTQHEDPAIRSTTTVRLLKARYDGSKVGQCVYLKMDPETGLLSETEKPRDGAAHGFQDESEAAF